MGCTMCVSNQATVDRDQPVRRVRVGVTSPSSPPSGEGEVEWVEIIEPQSNERMFANPVTGEILFSPPEGVHVKPLSQNQWWELYDQTSDMNYYYNAQTGNTVWDRPGEGADIIPLSKLQSLSDDQAVPESEQNGHSTPTPAAPGDQIAPSQNSPADPPSSIDHSIPLRGISVVFEEHQINPLSPLAMEVGGQKFSGFQSVDGEDSWEKVEVPDVGEVGRGRGEGVSPEQLVSRVDSPQDRAPSSHSHHSQDEAFDNANTEGRDSDLLKSRTLDHPRTKKPRPRLGSNPSPSPSRPAPAPKSKNKTRSPAHITPSHHTPSHLTPSQPPSSLPKTLSVDAGLADTKSIIPVAPPFKPRHSSPSIVPLEKFKELATHRRGLFRRKVTIANMLSWTKDAIKQPMIITRDKQLKKESCDLFKLVQQFMGDRQGKSKMKESDKLALTICSRCWEKKTLRDELYIQLCRQTTSNPNPKSLERGWQLLSIALAFFPPSIKFRSYLEGFVWRHVEPSTQSKGCQVEVYAEYCHKRVEKMVQAGAKRGLKKPTLEEVTHAKSAPFHPPLFGASLEEVMELQKTSHPHLTIPWVVIALCDVVLSLKGPETEGIFRVPGDIDEVNALKMKVEKGNIPVESLRDPHVPASLLKLWFRELEEPLIPEEYYEECIANCDRRHNAVSLMESLPDTNKELLYFLLRFLKNFVTPEKISRTKMGLENISMVWAPNFLRCPSDDHALIFQNTRKEMAFLRLLLKYLNLDGGGGGGGEEKEGGGGASAASP